MKINSIACVVTGERAVALKKYELEYENKGTLVKITRGGICGSDLHYYQHGRVGSYPVKMPMILGHEVIGIVEKSSAPSLAPGMAVAINPSKPCLKCEYCLEGNTNQCLNMRFFGSAMYFPHVDGGFTQYKIVENEQCIPFNPAVSGNVIVFAEPLAVAIHAVNQAGSVKGKRVFVSGVGPIGCLVVAAAKALGAEEIVATDISERCLQLARAMGADNTFTADAPALAGYESGKGFFDVAFEASGHPASIKRCVQVTRAKGHVVQVGMGGATAEIPLMALIAKEINLIGTFRFTEEFNTAVQWLEEKKINPLPLLSAEYRFEDFQQALNFAADKSAASKVQLVFA
ncbi:MULTISPECIES: L-idonate 5-dehydrogenase [Gibbsiella]|uniref:L-idonate 5-dehydrogenase n=1 Tax=Gibbsiella dentisursi TaxID=796890 RepID=A0ABP7KJB5_9GAMM|nr:L-idonate 5-dehydrogenase [Gibbsiella quercinecans]